MDESAGDIKFLTSDVPEAPRAFAAKAAREIFGLEGTLKALPSDRDANYKLASDQGDFILKFFHPDEDPAVIDFQTEALLHIQRHAPDLPVPHVRRTRRGDSMARVTAPDGRTSIVRLLTWLPGAVLGEVSPAPELLHDLGSTLARLDLALRGFFHPSARHTLVWDLRQTPALQAHVADIADTGARRNVEAVTDHFVRTILPRWDVLRSQVIHNDANSSNVVTRTDDARRVGGVIDFGDMVHAPLLCEIAMSAEAFTVGADDPIETIAEIARGYDQINPLEDDEIDLLFDHVLARHAMASIIIARRKVARTDSPAYLLDHEEPCWATIDRMLTIGAKAARTRLRKELRFPVWCPTGERDTPESEDLDDQIRRRHDLLGKRLSTFYKKPIHVERGRGAILFDANGRAFIDAYNNVPSVGHCHPYVVNAVSRQARQLATNTRYVYSVIMDYAEKLVATMPKDSGLDRVILVNSGSEANDVAWRMATMLTGRRGAIIMEEAYHGITEAIAALSPQDGLGLQPHVRLLQEPDTYRGPYGPKCEDAGRKYAADADRAVAELDEAGFGAACFMIDTSFCSNGIPDVPSDYLQEVARIIRNAGGLVIADEVQYGFGRPGTHMWGFDFHGMPADIVTMGKPAGDGFPLGVVVTTAEIQDEFFRRTGLFSTFGGNPVACAAGVAVLDVIERENLMENARLTGERLQKGLRRLMRKHALIGDVRGHGLITGVELVTDRRSKTPAGEELARVRERMRELGVLVGKEGRHGNVFKIRPPLVFGVEHADELIAAMDLAISEL
ncbi:MAG: aminotransferase class III-fold pyridoxal phosphate-dependent enzyme [Marivibrio sp.]|uniref:aminotransferase class III-fold pyridoxal phosphate-dependent enzyme n=1 Tax=Marivibrio sp. TaxID=2039719 RepID=UPI0032EB29FE